MHNPFVQKIDGFGFSKFTEINPYDNELITEHISIFENEKYTDIRKEIVIYY